MIAAAAASAVGVTDAIDAGAAPHPVAGAHTKATAALTLQGPNGRYLRFSGHQTQTATYVGALAFSQPVSDGAYTLTLTVTNAAGKKSQAIYEIQARHR